MATRQKFAVKPQMGLQRFTRVLALAFTEWLLMLMLFINSILSYLITRFADYSQLQSPCLMCSSLDHILQKPKHLKKSHWDMICSKHKSEISALVYCHAHGKLVDVRGMCETCLLSFDTTNKSNAETYRLWVGKLSEDSSVGSKSDQSKNPRNCTCCNQLWTPQTASTDQVAKPEMLPRIRVAGDVKIGKQSTPKKSVRFNNSPHVGYTKLKIHSDTESEAVFSEDEGVLVKAKDHKFHTVDLQTPRVITLPYDLATDKLINLDFPLQPFVARNDREEVHLQEIDLRTNPFIPELIPVNSVPETSKKVLKEEEIISFDNIFVTARTMEPPTAVLEKKDDLIHLQDVSFISDIKENPADVLMEETELIPVNVVSETSEKVVKEAEIISLDDLFLTPRSIEHPSVVFKENEHLIHLLDTSLIPDFNENPLTGLLEKTELISLNDLTSTSVSAETPEDVLMEEIVLKEKEDLIHLQDTSLTPDLKDNPENALTEETKLISINDISATSVATETPEDVLMEETVSKEKEELVLLQDSSSTPDFKENPIYALMEETELISLNDVTSTSVAAETPEDLLMDEIVLKEKEELILLQHSSSTPDFKENPAYVLMEESEIISLDDVTSTSDAAQTPEDVLKGIELMPLHDISLDEVPESFTAKETSVVTLKERDTNQTDNTSVESEDRVVSSSKSTTSIPENSTEKCVSEKKGMKDTSLTVSSVSEMASQTKAAFESESSSFNSMSVAAESNLDSGELLNLEDAYNIIVHNESNNDSSGEAQIEQKMKKDTSRVSEDLKGLLTQISSSRGLEFLSPRDISPRIYSDQDTKSLDNDMQLLIQKRMFERNESNSSMEGVSVSEIEGESESDRLKRQVDHDRKLLTGLYKELEEERNASAVATNQAMAMITRLQEEKALFQMEALQNLRMMEEQAEYDMEAIQKLNDLLAEREKLIQDLEAEIDYFRDETPQKKNLENVTKIDSPSERNKVQNCLTEFNEERLYITSCLEKIENRVQADENGEAHIDNLSTQESVSELHERVERVKGDLYFLEHVVNSLGQGNEGVEFVKEIASHLQTLRNLSMKRKDQSES